MPAYMDYISQLPETILHHILYYLPSNDATRTCILSKTWNLIQSRTPFLRFNQLYFPSSASLLSYAEKHLESRFSNSNNNAPIFSFRLSIIFYNNDRIDSLLKRVMNNGQTQQLDLRILDYRVPHFVLQSDTLTSLHLCGCKCDDANAKVRLPKLTTLHLYDAEVDDNFVESLTRGCSSLKHLKIHRCYSLTTLRVTCLERLETVSVKGCEDLRIVEIRSHCIRYNGYGGGETNKTDLTFSPSKKLILENMTIENSWLQRQFSMCEELRLEDIDCIDDIHISSQKLRKLKMKYVNMKGVAQINCPNLQSLVCVTNHLPFCSLCELKSLWNIRIEIFKDRKVYRDTLWFDKLNDLFQKFSSIEQAIIYNREEMIILDGFRQITIPEIFEIGDSIRSERVVISSISNSKQLNKLVKWVCKSIRCSKIYVASTNNNFSQVLFDKLSSIRAKTKYYGCHYLSNVSKQLSSSKDISPLNKKRKGNVSKDSATNTIPDALRSKQFDQHQITTIMLEFIDEFP